MRRGSLLHHSRPLWALDLVLQAAGKIGEVELHYDRSTGLYYDAA
jgi:hypothetical protein